MSKVSVAPYVLEEPDGSDARIVFPVNTPAVLVFVESRIEGTFTVKGPNREGVPIAIGVAKEYVRSHRGRLDQLYEQVARARVAPQ